MEGCDLDMDNEIIIYFNDRFVVLTDKIKKSVTIDNSQEYIFRNKEGLIRKISDFEKSEISCLYILHTDVPELFNTFVSCFTYLDAAGGVVENAAHQLLLIRRLGKWDLPKGKAEKKESLPVTAVREVVEECGLDPAPVITGDLDHTFHTYYLGDRHILKHTAWFTMAYNGDNDLHPQFSEDITEAVWLAPDRLDMVFRDTYKSIRQVLRTWKKSKDK